MLGGQKFLPVLYIFRIYFQFLLPDLRCYNSLYFLIVPTCLQTSAICRTVPHIPIFRLSYKGIIHEFFFLRTSLLYSERLGFVFVLFRFKKVS
jgi:hypothetical protein